MRHLKTFITALSLCIAPLAHAGKAAYYQDAAARWDATRTLLTFMSTTNIKSKPTMVEVDFEKPDAKAKWVDGVLMLEQGTIKLAFSNDPKLNMGVAPELTQAPSLPIKTRSPLFGRQFLKQSRSEEGERYLTIYSNKPLVGLGAVAYNRTSNSCETTLPAEIYSGQDLSTATQLENKINALPMKNKPGCANQTGKVDIIIALASKQQGSESDTFNYAVIDLGSPQKQMSLDNLLFYFAPQP
ncbi:hypothetical protein [Chitinimonas sp. BJB300]|uniref:hypothetical protein n=1 Tax=Chitinimonas sp. BJB300 TaxID=1559339 RepID=UPI000C114BAE|nr:hypothetical protein [Chitinimonas sp. BJB300]PHV11253.1 hypothetical protein CSQ89_11740 [Chitinimonas sp. BJB300]TSJ90785.1 hypothetical protein FG002_000230 [Chitinimonas sp. BJB300]